MASRYERRSIIRNALPDMAVVSQRTQKSRYSRVRQNTSMEAFKDMILLR
jgi:hypothetical protein